MRKFTTTLKVDQQTYGTIVELEFDGKKLDAKIDPQAIQDVKAMHGIDIVKEIINAFKHELRNEIPDVTDEELSQLDSIL